MMRFIWILIAGLSLTGCGGFVAISSPEVQKNRDIATVGSTLDAGEASEAGVEVEEREPLLLRCREKTEMWLDEPAPCEVVSIVEEELGVVEQTLSDLNDRLKTFRRRPSSYHGPMIAATERAIACNEELKSYLAHLCF